ncbi:OmpH family outer membrane protein [Flammeovirga yaeyamensis]|uniref:OmpH family outer membrane protein n=1 Tax=Flammeovirga yaeyamensis TaxID=367791 RepID=A0AAX1N0K9_9BACT|nr:MULTISPECIES: OmpH family outer membrane protein [Flammeovirga]ANQ47563.1 OmpH family outer membrane protein [Flammeovirga sp. MY04]MBB3698604.1 outer membrane protein [Flammeovirga yaeyamensis]NMF34048.1 OmpH family outer membrane protein [Flammeovirga yaeyamensis]QWG01036.1 OmpH family outer membrane protein [Flammeovirga yaeyamensis]
MKLRVVFASLFAVMLMGFGTESKAQTKIFAYADLDSVVRSIPEYETKIKELESYQNQLMASMQQQQQEFQTKYADFQQNQANWLPEIIQQKAQELELLQKNLQDFQQNAQQNLQKRQYEAFTPLQQKASEAVEAVAKEKGYQYVIPIDMLIYNNGADDITADVINKVK